MAKAAKSFCDRCEGKIVAGDSFCASCGYPTTWASHSERTAWEVAQYRHKTANVPMGYAYEPVRAAAPPAPKSHGVVRMFSRRAHIPQRQSTEQKRAEPLVVEPAPEPPAPRVKLNGRSKPAAAAKPSNADAEPFRDTPATLLAMRLLNAQVAELDGKLLALEREIAALRREKPRRRFSL